MAVTKLGAHGTPFPDLTGSSPNPPDGLLTQVGAEGLWSSTPTVFATQILVESLWSSTPRVYASQVGVELVIPYECVIQTPSVVCPDMPDGCPVPTPSVASGISCLVPSPTVASGVCIGEVPDPTCPQE